MINCADFLDVAFRSMAVFLCICLALEFGHRYLNRRGAQERA